MTLLDNENALKGVEARMGHSDIRTTERDLHSSDDRKVESIQSLDNLGFDRPVPFPSCRRAGNGTI